MTRRKLDFALLILLSVVFTVWLIIPFAIAVLWSLTDPAEPLNLLHASPGPCGDIPERRAERKSSASSKSREKASAIPTGRNRPLVVILPATSIHWVVR